MEFKQETIGDILTSEHEMVLHGVECYGEYYVNASKFNHLLQDFIKVIVDPEKFIFVAFLFQIKKYHTLALFSAVRRHHIQASMNLRYVIEAGQWAAYAMGNAEKENFFREDENEMMFVGKKHKKEMYKWLNENFKIKSDETKRLKKLISASAHSHIGNVFQNFHMTTVGDYGFKPTFFDIKDDYWVKTNLWFVANTALGVLDLFYGVNQQYEVFKLIDEFDIRFKQLVNQNRKLKEEMMNTDRFKNAKKLGSK